MIKKAITRVFTIITLIAVLQILTTIILARNLSKTEMGIYRLLLNIVEIASLLSLFGIDHSFVRFFSSAGISFSKYDWIKFLKKFFMASFAIVIFIASIAGLTYKLSFPAILFIVIVTPMIASIFMLSAFLRAMQKYQLAIFINRMNFVLFFIFLSALWIFKNITLVNVLTFYTFTAILANLIVVCYCLKNIPSGNTQIPLSVIKNGLYYFGNGISLILILQAGPLIIAKMLSYKDLALYTITASIMRIFEFIYDSCYHVLTPYLNVKTNAPAKKIFKVLLLMAFLTAIFYMLAGKMILHLLFKGLYDEGAYLLPLFIAIGTTRILYTLPASIIGGRSSESILRNQFFVMLSIAILNIILNYVLINKMALTGAAVANLISWILLFLITFSATQKYIINESDYASG